MLLQSSKLPLQIACRAAFEEVNVAVLSVFKSQLRESPALTELLLG